MSLELSIADDFASIADWLKPVEVDGTTADAALRRAVNTQELGASGGRYVASDTVFHIDSAQYTDRPAIGGTITDEDGNWTILSVGWQTFVKRWRCVSRQLVIPLGPDGQPTTVTIQAPTYAKGLSGAEEPTYTTLASGIAASVQYDRADVEVEHANRVATTVVRVFFAATRELGPGFRILVSDGAVLKVLSWNGFDEIDQFFTATCEVSKWPQN